MKKNNTQTTCPNCGHQIDVSEMLYTKIQKAVEKDVQLKMKEKDLLIAQLGDQLKDMHKKTQQGSMQLQGEVQEILIEEWLKTNFPLDTITEVKKGARGADSLQVINTRTKDNLGSIYYESKSTKVFQSGWIEKFKEDMRAINATIGILVTDAFPKDKERLYQVDNIWVCSLEEFKSLCFVVREFIILLGEASEVQSNKTDKASLLYSYIISKEFQNEAVGIVETFVQQQVDLEKERRAFEALSIRKDKQFRKSLMHFTNLFSSIKGIIGSKGANIPLLESPEPHDANKDSK